MGTWDRFVLMFELAVRSLFSHRLKTIIVGGILLLGTFVVAFATSMLNSVETAMERSITGSLIGQLQVLSKDATDDLAFFGQNANGAQDLGIIKDFRKTREVLEKLPEVDAVVPMGRETAQIVGGGNILDRQLEVLRKAVGASDTDKIEKSALRIRQLAELVRQEQMNRLKLSSAVKEVEANLAIIDRATSDAFWAEFKANPLPALDWMDTKLAPLQSDEQMLFLAYIGTDVERFSEHFGAFQMYEGAKMPPGERGLLVGKEFRERQAKNAIARQFDDIKRARDIDQKRFDSDEPTKKKADRIGRQYKRILYELGPDESALVEADLREFFGSKDGTLQPLLEKLCTLDDANFERHYEGFYKIVAPRIRLYSVNVGETVTLRVFTRTGYTRSLNVKVAGVFGFKGLDGSLIASAYNMMDLMTFRDLFGLMTPERRAELETIKANVGVKEVAAADAEAALFGDDATLEGTAEAGAVEEPVQVEPTKNTEPAVLRPATQEEIDSGVVVHAAIVLKPDVGIAQATAAVERAIEANALELKVVNWEQASGIIGQLIWTLRIVLYIAFGILLAVALAIINNSLIMATMNRIQEIGTFRAIGAQKGFVVGMLLVETVLLAVLACGIGLGFSELILHGMSSNGLSARGNEMLIVMFGGPKLFPGSTLTSIAISLGAVGLVSFLATLYPAFLATRVQPVVAMQNRE